LTQKVASIGKLLHMEILGICIGEGLSSHNNNNFSVYMPLDGTTI